MILFLGDAVLRVPAPRESMALIRSIDAQGVRGNYDWFVIGNFPRQEERFVEEPFLPDEVAWTKELLSDEDLDYLHQLPITFRLFEGTPMEVVVCHASPGRAFGGLFPHPDVHRWGMSDEECLALLEGEPAPTVLCAHTHAVMDRTVGRYRIINPGSVSLGWNERDQMDGLARWALLTWKNGNWQVEFHTETYPHEPVWEAYLRWPLWPKLRDYPKPKWWGERVREFAESERVPKPQGAR